MPTRRYSSLLTFLSPAPILRPSLNAVKPVSSFPRQHFPFFSRRRRPRHPPQASVFNEDSLLSDIAGLDERERVRRASLPSTPKFQLSDENKEILMRRHPNLAKLDEMVENDLKDIDLEDYRIGTWAYHEFIDRRFTWWMVVGVGVGVYVIVRRLVKGMGVGELVRAGLKLEMAVGGLVGIAWIVLLAAMLGRREREKEDAVVRGLLMFGVSSLWLVLMAMFSSVGYGGTGAMGGVLARLGPMAMSLWWWRDLRVEVEESRVILAKVYMGWRWIVTGVVILLGAFVRVLGLGEGVGKTLVRNAGKVRLRVVDMFPVSMSLCRDVRGFYLLVCVCTAVGLAYLVYLVVYVIDLMKVRNHRAIVSVFTALMVRWGVYMPNVREGIREACLSGGEGSLIPSAAMMLRKRENDLSVDSSYLSTEMTMPILSLLDKEDEVLEKEGIDSWIRPRGEDVPLGNGLTKEKRSLEALMNWARPPSDEEANMSFAEFFDTLEDDEYQYDPNSGNWVFSNDEDMMVEEVEEIMDVEEIEKFEHGEKIEMVEMDKGGKIDEQQMILDKITETWGKDGLNVAELEKVVKELTGMDLLDFASSDDLHPFLRNAILKHHGRPEEDFGDPFFSVTV